LDADALVAPPGPSAWGHRRNGVGTLRAIPSLRGRTTAEPGLAGTHAVLRGAAIGLLLLCAGLITAFVALAIAAHNAHNTPGNLVVYVVTTAVGFLLALRLPKLPIGWIALIAVLIAMLQDIAKTYLLASRGDRDIFNTAGGPARSLSR
jgi:hypothetical protein